MGKLWEPREIYTLQRGPRRNKTAAPEKKIPYRHIGKKLLWQSGISLLIFILVWVVFQFNAPLVQPLQSNIRAWFSEDYSLTPVIKFFNDVGLWGDTFERAAFEASKFSESPEILAVPVSGQITRPFGWITEGGETQGFHDGILISAVEGVPVKAALGGTVTRLANEEERGRIIEIKSADGMIFTYGHLQEVLVNLNDEIMLGQVIAKVGKTGNAEAPQLYFRVTKDGVALDPAELFMPAAESI